MNANFARPLGAKDKKPRKKRKKTRLEANIQRQTSKVTSGIKKQFEPEPTKIQKLIETIKNNPGKVLTGVSGLLGAGALAFNKGAALTSAMKKFDPEQIRLLKEKFKTVINKPLPNLKNLKNKKRKGRGSQYNEENNIIEFARKKGAKDKKKRKPRKKKTQSEISAKTKDDLAKAQAFRARLMPIIQGVREARSTIRMLKKASSFSTASFADKYQQDMPLVLDMVGQQIKGRGGIVKILANLIGSERSYILDYKPTKYNSINRYYERNAALLADTQGNLLKAKDVGGKPDINKGQVYGQQGIEAKKGKVGGSMLNRQYSSYYDNAEFESDLVNKYKSKFKKLFGKGKKFASETYKKGKKKMKDAKVGTKVAGAALKGAYKTGRYHERYLGGK